MKSVLSAVSSPSALDSLANYVGSTDFDGWDCVVTQNRDSHSVARSNFRSALKQLGGECDNCDNVKVHRFGHWCCGWWELIAVKQNTSQHKIAQEICDGLTDYPVLDDEDLSTLEYEEAISYWKHTSLKDRVEMCKHFHVNILAARHADILPETSSGELCTWEE